MISLLLVLASIAFWGQKADCWDNPKPLKRFRETPDACWYRAERIRNGLLLSERRYYDPEIGRFINADNVIAGAGRSVQG
mgnify:CR=1 FL=1|jgi:hypothetical protein